MCGIAGILKLDGSARVDDQVLLRMRDSLTHRGPDGAGLMVQGRIGLAHRRLSIIDVDGGHQPMHNTVGDCWITYNGELYNYKDLRAELVRQGCTFSTESDTEVLLSAYQVYGDACVTMLDGMFAFAIWDNQRKRLLMGRDRIGIKPLYYSISDTELRFGSEIKALLVDAEHPHEFNRDIVSEFLANRYVSGAETFFKGITKLMPAHTLSWSEQEGFHLHRFWEPPETKENVDGNFDYFTARIKDSLYDAVRSHLVSDVPVGLFLSGGLDSTALGAIMATISDNPIQTFSVGFEEASANELAYAQLAADAIGADHRSLTVSPAQFFAALPHLIWHEDEPLAFSSSIPLHLLSCMANKHVKVVLTGEGADELFLGYDYRYRISAFNQRWGHRYERISSRQAREMVAGVIPHLPRHVRRYAERSFLMLGTDPRLLFCENFSVFRVAHRMSVLNGHHHEYADPHRHAMHYLSAAGDDLVQGMSHADLQTYLVELLMKQDQMSMSASLESRVPFLDNQLVQLVASIPSRYKMRGSQTKSLLRAAVKDIVPARILNRKKMGFPVPISSWLRGPFRSLIDNLVLGERAMDRGLFNTDAIYKMAREHMDNKFDHGERLWLLLNLEIWQRIFVDHIAPSAVYGDCKDMYRTLDEGRVFDQRSILT